MYREREGTRMIPEFSTEQLNESVPFPMMVKTVRNHIFSGTYQEFRFDHAKLGCLLDVQVEVLSRHLG